MQTRAQMTVGLVLGLALAVAGCDGKGTAGTCSTYAACGGDPKGDWTLTDGCENLVVNPYQEPSLPQQLQQPQYATQAPPQPEPTTSGDWCSQLVYEPSTKPSMPVQGVVLWHGPPTVSSGYLHQNADGTYDALIQFKTAEHTYFANACLTRFETTAPSCAKLGTDLQAYLASQPSFKFDTGAAMACTGDSSVGCDCEYNYQVQAPDMGTWRVDPSDGKTIIYAGTTRTEPQSATFCRSGGTLELSGANGSSLFSAQGVRSAKFQLTTP